MIRTLLIIGILFCLAAMPARAAFWPFSSGDPADSTPKVFNTPTKDKPKNNSAFLQKLFGAPPASPQQVSPKLGAEFEKLTPEMLTASYTPKTVEEMQLIANAHRSWEDVAIAQMDQAANARIAIADAKSKAGLRQLQLISAQYQTRIAQENAGAVAAATNRPPPLMSYPVDQQSQQLIKPVIYNSKPLAPNSVFKNYR